MFWYGPYKIGLSSFIYIYFSKVVENNNFADKKLFFLFDIQIIIFRKMAMIFGLKYSTVQFNV